jgi:hypothetical protein
MYIDSEGQHALSEAQGRKFTYQASEIRARTYATNTGVFLILQEQPSSQYVTGARLCRRRIRSTYIPLPPIFTTSTTSHFPTTPNTLLVNNPPIARRLKLRRLRLSSPLRHLIHDHTPQIRIEPRIYRSHGSEIRDHLAPARFTRLLLDAVGGLRGL